MKITFLSDNLKDKISFLNHAVSNRGQLPILSNFLLVARSGKLTVSSTDLEIGISVSFSVKVEKEGKTTVPAKNFSELLTNLPNEKITLSLEGESLKVEGSKVKASFQTMQPDDFPRFAEEKGEEKINIKKKEILDFLQRVVFAAAIDSSRPALSGIYLEKDRDGVLMVATDSFRLSLQKNVFGKSDGLKKPIVIPSRILKELMSIKEDDDNISLFISDKNNQILFTEGDTVLVGRVIDAEYPAYQKIIPQDFNTKVEVSREELLQAIKICSIFARETANIIKFSIEKNKLVVSANAPSVGEDSVEVEAKVAGEENQIAFNAKYLLDILSSLESEGIVFEMSGPLNPGVLKIKGDNSFLHLIMPIRVQE